MNWTMRPNLSKLNIAFISDIHLGHHRTHSSHIIENLRKAFPKDSPETKELDAVFFAGDVFDRLLNLPQEVVDEIQLWISDFLRMCEEFDIVVRVLEGTPSHDWKQPRQFLAVNSTLERPAKVKYIDTLSIETIDELGGLTVLYVPDEWNDKAEVTQSQVKDLLKIHNLETVDIACMHGHFEYQLPVDSPKNHNSSYYQSITNYYVTIGHVHIRSELGNILAQGSFDRLSHGEESDKGHYRCSISPSGKRHWFVPNKGAKIYKTIDCSSMDVAQLMGYFSSLSEYPMKSHFRLQMSKDSSTYNAITKLKEMYPQFVITNLPIEAAATPDQLAIPTVADLPKAITVTKENVISLITPKLESFGIPEPVVERGIQLLKEWIQRMP